MAIDFDSPQYADPNIRITPREVPLEAMVQTGQTLQNRFEKSYENETKTQALARKLMQSVDPADQELANEIMSTYETRLANRAKQGDYHNMRWQTLQDAQDFSNIYEGLSTRAAKKGQYRDAILTNKNIADPEKRKYFLNEWLKTQENPQFNPDNRVLTGLNVTAPQFVEDYDLAKFVDTFGKGFEADITGAERSALRAFNAGEKLPSGSTAPIAGLYDIKTGRRVERVKDSDVKGVLNNYLSSTPEAQAYLDSEKNYLMSKGYTPEAAEAYVQRNVVDKAINAASAKYGYKRDLSTENIDFKLATGKQGDAGEGLYTPSLWTNPNTISKGQEINTGASYGVTDPLKRRDALNMLRYFGKNGSTESFKKSAGELHSTLKQIYDIADKMPDEDKSKLEKIMKKTSGIANPLYSEDLASLDLALLSGKKGNEKLLELVRNYNSKVGSGFFDTNFENQFEKETSNPYSQSFGIRQISLSPNADKLRSDISSFSNDLAPSNFDFIDGKEKFEGNKIRITGVGTQPISGVGIPIEVEDSKGNKAIVTPKKQTGDGVYEALDNYYPGIAYANYFKGVSDFYLGEARTISDILEESNLKGTEIAKKLSPYKNTEITLEKDGSYTMTTPKGKVPVPDYLTVIQQLAQ